MQNLTSYSCSATPISYIGDEISRLSCLVIEFPIFGYLGVLGFLGYLATSDAKSDVIFLLGVPDFLYRRGNFAPILRSYRVPHFWLFGGIGFWGYLATSNAKSDVIFLLSDPDFLLGGRNFAQTQRHQFGDVQRLRSSHGTAMTLLPYTRWRRHLHASSYATDGRCRL